MKKSSLSGLFSEECDSADKSLLTYHGPQQPGPGGRPAADSPPPPTSHPPPSAVHQPSPDVESPPGENASPVVGTGTPPGDPAAPATPELLHSCVVSAFTFSGAQSVPLGALGCAIYWEPARHRSLLVLYKSRQQQTCLLTLTPATLPAVQPHLYVSFQCDAGRRFSVHLPSPAALRQLAMKAVLAAVLATPTGPAAALLLPGDEDSSSGGRRARQGDSLQLEVTVWGVERPRSEVLRQRGAVNHATATLDRSWCAALRGARPGERWLVAEPAAADLVREVLLLAVRPPGRSSLQLPVDDGTDWRPGEDGTSAPIAEAAEAADGCVADDPDLPELHKEAEDEVERTAPAAAAPGRGDVLSRMARLGQQMFPPAVGAGRGRSPSPPPSPPPSPAARSPPPVSDAPTSQPPQPTPAAATATTAATTSTTTAKPPVIARRPTLTPRPDGTELGVLLGRLEVKLETVLSRLSPPAGVDADAETLAAGVRRLAAENAALREQARQAEDATERRLEAERSRAGLAAELADSLSALTESRRRQAESQRRLAEVEAGAAEAEAAATRRESQLAARLAAAEAEAEATRGTQEPRRLLRGLYRTLRARFSADAMYSGAQVADVVAEVMRKALQRQETESESGSAGKTEANMAEGEEGVLDRAVESEPKQDGLPPFVNEDECVERGDD